MNQDNIAQSTSSQDGKESSASNNDIEATHDSSDDRKGNKRSRDPDKEEISRLRQEIKELKQKLREEKHRSDQKIQEVIQQGKQQRKKLKQQLKNNSVMRYADLKDGDIELDLNNGTQSSSVNPKNHEEAEPTIKSDVWYTKFDLSEIMSTLGTEVGITMNSKLFTNKSGKGSKALVLDYGNETEVQIIVRDFLVDAVNTCNELIKKVAEASEKLPPSLKYRSECSMFKERPDHMVVYDINSHAPLVTIEVKKPLPPEKRGLDKYRRVCGQGFDYLMATKMIGNVCPMHITTTVDESYVAWLPESYDTVRTFNTDPQKDLVTVLSDIIEKVPRQSGGVKLTQSPLKEERREVDHSEEKKDETPVTPTNTVNENKIKREISISTPTNTVNEKKIKREISISKTYRSHDLFCVMVNAILCAMCSSSRGNTVIPLDIGVIVSQLALKLFKEKFEWVEIGGITIKGSIKEEPSLTTAIYAVGVVGFGATSKAFRVITEDGYEGVLKMYVKETDVDDKTVLSKEEYQSNAKESVKRELTIFKNTYPDMPVFKVKLADHYGLLMPFFKPLDHKRDQVDTRTIIEALEKIQNGKSSYVYYRDEDVSWRHFGKYDNKQIVAFDFNDMDETTLNGDARNKKISEQCEDLFECIPPAE